MRSRRWTDDQLTAAVKTSTSLAQVFEKLGLTMGGGVYYSMQEHIRRLDLDTSHFKGRAWNRGRPFTTAEAAEALLPLLQKGVYVGKLRHRLVRAGLKEERCEECKITSWQGKPAPLQLDHIDGDPKNNLLENLRLLCANCHVQTETWGFKHARRKPIWGVGSIEIKKPSVSGGTVDTPA